MTKMDRPGITGDLYMYKEVLVKFIRFDHVGICIADLELKRDSNMVSQKKKIPTCSSLANGYRKKCSFKSHPLMFVVDTKSTDINR